MDVDINGTLYEPDGSRGYHTARNGGVNRRSFEQKNNTGVFLAADRKNKGQGFTRLRLPNIFLIKAILNWFLSINRL